MFSLTILIPSYRRVDLLDRCLTSVLAHKPAGAEILVVDDASTGGVVSQTAERYPGVQVHRLPRRAGFCGAVNAGLTLARGDVVELLNDDTEVTAGWAAAALTHFANPRVAAVAPLVLQLNPGQPIVRIDSAGDGYDPGGFAFKRGYNRPANLSEFQQAGEVWGVSGAAGFFRRNAVLAAGGLPDDFGAYFEDVDLAHRLRRQGAIAWYEPKSIVWHRVSASYGRRPGRTTLQQQSCNEERLFWRNTPPDSLLRYLPRHAAVLLGKAIRRLGEGNLTPWLTGRLRAWHHELRSKRTWPALVPPR